MPNSEVSTVGGKSTPAWIKQREAPGSSGPGHELVGMIPAVTIAANEPESGEMVVVVVVVE
jgi:D-arabinose 1-dehydrogenase-like Zn-dependent alcohol dehydrogenase